jgi:SAM-dependent methyltransferase
MSSHDIERWSPFKVWLFGLFNKTPESNLAIIDRIGLDADDRFLDVGCGLGAAMERAAATGAQVFGVDPSPAMVEKAASRVPGADVRVGSAESIPYPDDHFTVVINVSSYHHWAEPQAGLREILRVLAPGGRLYVVEGKLKGRRKHGLTPVGADDLAASLLDLGYEESSVDLLDIGRHGYLVVGAQKPS